MDDSVSVVLAEMDKMRQLCLFRFGHMTSLTLWGYSHAAKKPKVAIDGWSNKL